MVLFPILIFPQFSMFRMPCIVGIKERWQQLLNCLRMFIKKSNHNSLLADALFFAFFCIYIFYWINPGIVYFIQQPIFLVDKTFFIDHLKYPGGLVEYVSQFLSQFYYYPWLGALIITSTAFFISMITNQWLKFLGVKKANLILKLIPALILLSLYSNPHYLLTTSMMLLSSMLGIHFYLRNYSLTAHSKATILILSSAILFFLCGGISILFYILICFAFELFDKKNSKSSVILFLAIVISGSIPYLLTRFFFFMTYKKAYFHLFVTETYYKPAFFLFILYIFFPLMLFCIRLYFKAFPPKESTSNPDHGSIQKKHSAKLSFALQAFIVILFAFLLIKYSVDTEEQLVSKIKYLACQEKWEEVLKLAKEKPSDDRLINFHTNRALYHTGRLSYDLFDYPQNWGKQTLFLGEIVDPNVLMDNSDLYFDLGHISSAKHWAYEAQTIYENSPRILKQLALSNIILGNTDAANTVLGILEKSFLYKDWVSYYQNCLHDSLFLEKDSLIQEKRKMLPTTDFYMDRKNPDIDLLYILEDHNNNMMAFEYLMMYYLLSNKLIKFVDNLNYLKILNYQDIPKVYEEALIIYLTRKDVKKISLPGYNLSVNTLHGFEDYARILIRYNKNKELARSDLHKYYGNSYWFYLHYISPVTNKKELKYTPGR